MDGTTIFRFAILSCALFLVGNGWITVTTLNPEINAVMKGGKTRRRKNKIQ